MTEEELKNTPCLIYPGYKKDARYGKMNIGGKFFRPHRLALMCKLGRHLKNGMNANHHCDNPSCVNPWHLYEGTQSENMKDAFRRGRKTSNLRGEKHHSAKLTENIVKQIRARYSEGKTTKEICVEFGISVPNANKIRSREIWGYLD